MQAVRVEARNIELAYGATQVLRDISLTVEPGEFFALLGPSGSGKSTLLRLIAGFNQHQAGRAARSAARTSPASPPWKRNVGMVFQNYALWPHMTVARNVAFGLEERRLPRERGRGAGPRPRSSSWASPATASAARASSPAASSSASRSRARSRSSRRCCCSTSRSRTSTRSCACRCATSCCALHERLGITTIFVTHDQEEAMTICDRIAVMDQGVIQQVGTPIELFDQPANRFVAQLRGLGEPVRGRAPRRATVRLADARRLPAAGGPAARPPGPGVPGVSSACRAHRGGRGGAGRRGLGFDGHGRRRRVPGRRGPLRGAGRRRER